MYIKSNILDIFQLWGGALTSIPSLNSQTCIISVAQTFLGSSLIWDKKYRDFGERTLSLPSGTAFVLPFLLVSSLKVFLLLKSFSQFSPKAVDVILSIFGQETHIYVWIYKKLSALAYKKQNVITIKLLESCHCNSIFNDYSFIFLMFSFLSQKKVFLKYLVKKA